MSKTRSNRISTLGSQISTIISVSLVLLIVGLILVISSLTNGANDALRQNIALVIRMSDSANAAEIDELYANLSRQPYASSLKYYSADDVLREEMKYNPEILSVLGANPYTAEFELFLYPQYVDADSIVKITQNLEYLSTVSEVYSQVEVVKNVNNVLRKSTLLLSILGLVMVIISIVLLFNTINLVIYARRFTIHTMKLVGATPGFIRAPFVKAGVTMGIVSGIIASALLCALHFYTVSSELESLFFVDWLQTGLICGALMILGAIFCGTAAWIATNRFIGSSYDNLVIG